MSVMFHAMGTTWWLDAERQGPLADAAARVVDLERRLSRFREGSAVRRLGRERTLVDGVLAHLVRRALAVGEATDGAFCVTLGAELVAWGYARGDVRWAQGTSWDLPSLPATPAPAERTTVEVAGDRVTLRGPGELDLGGIAKGYTVDVVHDALRAAGCAWAWVDGGGDLRASGRPMPVGLPGDRSVMLHHAVATSSTQRRRWRDGTSGAPPRHHVLDPRTRAPASSGVHTVTVLAPDCATADALATALLVEPALSGRLAGSGVAALLTAHDGTAWVTEGWPTDEADPPHEEVG